MVAERRCPSPILCEDLGTIRGEIFPEYGPERMRLMGANGGYAYPIVRVNIIKNHKSKTACGPNRVRWPTT